MHDYYKEFLKLVPSGKPGDVGLEYPHAEIERIRHKCEASALLCDLRTLRQYTVPDTAPSSEEAVVEIRRTLGVKVHESLARVAEQIIEKLNRALSNGRWSYADIGTGNQEVCMMVAAIVRYSGTETLGERSTYETHVTFLKDTVSNLSLTFGVDFRPILATALAQKSPAKEGESGALTEAQA
ncbi:MAG: hypothetical protein Q7R64_00570 [bacterium]|nr:hypothetical protein [bacterium]